MVPPPPKAIGDATLKLYSSWASILPTLVEPLLEYEHQSIGKPLTSPSSILRECINGRQLDCEFKTFNILCLFPDRKYMDYDILPVIPLILYRLPDDGGARMQMSHNSPTPCHPWPLPYFPRSATNRRLDRPSQSLPCSLRGIMRCRPRDVPCLEEVLPSSRLHTYKQPNSEPLVENFICVCLVHL